MNQRPMNTFALVGASLIIALVLNAGTTSVANAQYKQVRPFLAQGNEGGFTYIHAAIYAPIDLSLGPNADWAASPMALSTHGSTFIEAGWYRNPRYSQCSKPNFCIYSSWNSVSTAGSGWKLKKTRFREGERPWFQVFTEDCEHWHSFGGKVGKWSRLTPSAGIKFSNSSWPQVTSMLEAPATGITLGNGNNTNRWTENTMKRLVGGDGDACNQTALTRWDYQGVSPNGLGGTVTSLGNQAWRISVP